MRSLTLSTLRILAQKRSTAFVCTSYVTALCMSCLPACLPAYLPACLPAYLPACAAGMACSRCRLTPPLSSKRFSQLLPFQPQRFEFQAELTLQVHVLRLNDCHQLVHRLTGNGWDEACPSPSP